MPVSRADTMPAVQSLAVVRTTESALPSVDRAGSKNTNNLDAAVACSDATRTSEGICA